ncbi:hypothetical protein M9H77_23151 [Catharanthus roseus]|uniref:Uncharacterized protein n=1 Tax=Catharanthus roseus TaxID=4058 RepID=A0ACC0AV76_CATRO|nr:hypothetical protein M9H77_23151 [Catharanthus roseus]
MTSQPSPSNIQTPNRFQALRDFPPLTYSMAAKTPSFKLQHSPPISSTQHASSTSTQYFTKPITTSITLTSFTEVLVFKYLNSKSFKISFKDFFLRNANGYLMIPPKHKPIMNLSSLIRIR